MTSCEMVTQELEYIDYHCKERGTLFTKKILSLKPGVISYISSAQVDRPLERHFSPHSNFHFPIHTCPSTDTRVLQFDYVWLSYAQSYPWETSHGKKHSSSSTVS
jgi:hypothetical protein